MDDINLSNIKSRNILICLLSFCTACSSAVYNLQYLVSLYFFSFVSLLEAVPTRRSDNDLPKKDKCSIVTTDTGYYSNRSRSPYNTTEGVRSEQGNRNTETVRVAPADEGNKGLERPGFKTREEFQRDFERREQQLKELLSRPRITEQTEHESLGTTVRSDPGGMLDDGGPRWENRVSDHTEGFHRLEPEPAYPENRLRYSRSKSDTDLAAFSPSDSQKYSSPMHPGKILNCETMIFCGALIFKCQLKYNKFK